MIAFKKVCCYSDHNGAQILAVKRRKTTNTSYMSVTVKIVCVLHVINCKESKSTTSFSADAKLLLTTQTGRQISQHDAYDQRFPNHF